MWVMETGKLGFSFETGYVFGGGSRCVAAAILAAVEGGILPPGRRRQIASAVAFSDNAPFPPGRMPGSTAGKMPAVTVNTYGTGISSTRLVRLARAKFFSAWEQFVSSARMNSSNRRNLPRNRVFRDLSF